MNKKQIIIDYNEYLEMIKVSDNLFELLNKIKSNKNISIKEIKKNIIDILGINEI